MDIDLEEDKLDSLVDQFFSFIDEDFIVDEETSAGQHGIELEEPPSCTSGSSLLPQSNLEPCSSNLDLDQVLDQHFSFLNREQSFTDDSEDFYSLTGTKESSGTRTTPRGRSIILDESEVTNSESNIICLRSSRSRDFSMLEPTYSNLEEVQGVATKPDEISSSIQRGIELNDAPSSTSGFSQLPPSVMEPSSPKLNLDQVLDKHFSFLNREQTLPDDYEDFYSLTGNKESCGTLTTPYGKLCNPSMLEPTYSNLEEVLVAAPQPDVDDDPYENICLYREVPKSPDFREKESSSLISPKQTHDICHMVPSAVIRISASEESEKGEPAPPDCSKEMKSTIYLGSSESEPSEINLSNFRTCQNGTNSCSPVQGFPSDVTDQKVDVTGPKVGEITSLRKTESFHETPRPEKERDDSCPERKCGEERKLRTDENRGLSRNDNFVFLGPRNPKSSYYSLGNKTSKEECNGENEKTVSETLTGQRKRGSIEQKGEITSGSGLLLRDLTIDGAGGENSESNTCDGVEEGADYDIYSSLKRKSLSEFSSEKERKRRHNCDMEQFFDPDLIDSSPSIEKDLEKLHCLDKEIEQLEKDNLVSTISEAGPSESAPESLAEAFNCDVLPTIPSSNYSYPSHLVLNVDMFPVGSRTEPKVFDQHRNPTSTFRRDERIVTSQESSDGAPTLEGESTSRAASNTFEKARSFFETGMALGSSSSCEESHRDVNATGGAASVSETDPGAFSRHASGEEDKSVSSAISGVIRRSMRRMKHIRLSGKKSKQRPKKYSEETEVRRQVPTFPEIGLPSVRSPSSSAVLLPTILSVLTPSDHPPRESLPSPRQILDTSANCSRFGSEETTTTSSPLPSGRKSFGCQRNSFVPGAGIPLSPSRRGALIPPESGPLLEQGPVGGRPSLESSFPRLHSTEGYPPDSAASPPSRSSGLFPEGIGPSHEAAFPGLHSSRIDSTASPPRPSYANAGLSEWTPATPITPSDVNRPSIEAALFSRLSSTDAALTASQPRSSYSSNNNTNSNISIGSDSNNNTSGNESSRTRSRNSESHAGPSSRTSRSPDPHLPRASRSLRRDSLLVNQASSQRSRGGSIGGFLPPKRSLWPHTNSGLFAALPVTLNLFNISRFAVLGAHFGWQFPIQWFIISLVIGVPLMTFHAAIGQTIGGSVVDMWTISPIFQGVGLGFLLVEATIGVYCCVPVAWLFTYFRDSFNMRKFRCILPSDCDTARNMSNEINRYVTGYFSSNVLQRSEDGASVLNTLGSIKVDLSFNIVLIWVITLLALSRGVRSYGKVCYLVFLLPFVCFFSVAFYLVYWPNHPITIEQFQEIFTDRHSWMAASREAFMVWGLHGAVFQQMASGNKKRHPLWRDTTVITFLTFLGLGLSAACGIVFSSVMSKSNLSYVHSSFETEKSRAFVEVKQQRSDGPLTNFYLVYDNFYVGIRVRKEYFGLQRPGSPSSHPITSGYNCIRFLTEMFPALLFAKEQPIVNVWPPLFYLGLLLSGLAHQLAVWHTVVQGLIRMNYKLLAPWETFITFCTCLFALSASILMATGLGIHILYFLDYVVGCVWWIMILQLILVFAVLFVRGKPYTAQAIAKHLFGKGKCCSTSWTTAPVAFSWTIMVPVGLLVLSISSFKTGNYREVFAWESGYWSIWTCQLASGLQLFPLLLVPLIGLIQTLRYLANPKRDLFERIQHLYRPPPFRGFENSYDDDALMVEDRALRLSYTADDESPDNSDATAVHRPFSDPPPKYTPPPSYSTATGSGVTKFFGHSWRRSVRRLRNALLTTQYTEASSATEEPYIPPPDYTQPSLRGTSPGPPQYATLDPIMAQRALSRLRTPKIENRDGLPMTNTGNPGTASGVVANPRGDSVFSLRSSDVSRIPHGSLSRSSFRLPRCLTASTRRSVRGQSSDSETTREAIGLGRSLSNVELPTQSEA